MVHGQEGCARILDWDPEDLDGFSDAVRQAPDHGVSDVLSMLVGQSLSFCAKVFKLPVMFVHLEIVSAQLGTSGEGWVGCDYVFTHYILENDGGHESFLVE